MRISDWSSDVCSSDLHGGTNHRYRAQSTPIALHQDSGKLDQVAAQLAAHHQAAGQNKERQGQHGKRLRRRKHLLGDDHKRREIGRSNGRRSEEHTSELQSLMRISYAVFCLKKKQTNEHSRKTALQK